MSQHDSLLVSGDVRSIEDVEAGEQIETGSLIEFNAAGDAIKHDDADEQAAAWFAAPSPASGLTLEDDIENDDALQVEIFESGSRHQARVIHNTDINGGAALVSNGDGSLKAYGAQSTGEGDTVETGNVVAYAPPEGIDTGDETAATLQEVIAR